MRYPILITSDLHLTASASTEYRWGLFPWLASQIREHHVRTLLILGDLTDAKDNHPAELVNRIVKVLGDLRIDDIRILAGNHDWLKQGHEFFKFLNVLPNVKFITNIEEDMDDHGPAACFLPYSKNPVEAWAGRDFSHFDLLFMHQTVRGSVASNGQVMDGEPLPALDAVRVYSGDIHVPQVIGPVTYVGSPYHVHMGDRFKPRCILLGRSGAAQDLHFETISRITLRVANLAELSHQPTKPGDHVRVVVELPIADAHGWAKLRNSILDLLRIRKVVVHGVELKVVGANKRVAVGHGPTRQEFSPHGAVLRFVEREELGGELLDAAYDIMETKV